LRVPIESYLQATQPGVKVHSLVASFPFSPVDIDLGRLARGEWRPVVDRFRVWYLPGEGTPLCYVMIRKLDPHDMVLVYAHLVFNIGKPDESDAGVFTMGILCNDDVRARAALNSLLDIPPSFHRRSDVRMRERKWRDDANAVMRFTANVHSAMATAAPGASFQTVSAEPPPEALKELKRGLGTWWD